MWLPAADPGEKLLWHMMREGRAFSGHRGFIAGLGTAQIVSWGSLIYAFPILAGPMGAEFGWGRTEIFGLASLALAIAGLAAYPVGRTIDRGHGRWIMAGGSILGALALLAWAYADAGWMLPPVFMLVGLAQVMTLYESGFAVVSRRYGGDARRGITALTLWGGFASTVFVPLTQFLLDRFGWRGTLEMLAILNLALSLPLHLWIIDRQAAATRAAAPSDDGTVRCVLRQPAFWGLMAAFTLYYALFSGISFHMYPLLGERGLSTASVVMVMTLIGPAQVAGRLIVAAVAERAPIRRVGIGTILALPMAMALLLLPLGDSMGVLVLFAAIYGAANGIMTIIRGAAVPEMLTRRAYGAVNGLLSLPGSICKALAPLLVAMLWDLSGSYRPVLWLGIIACVPILAGFLLAAFKRPPGHSSPPS